MAQCTSMGTRNRITTPIHYMYISYTIWVPCIPMRTRNCINMLIELLCVFTQSGYLHSINWRSCTSCARDIRTTFS